MSDFMEVETAESWKAKGNEFYKNKNYKEAIEAYSRAIALDPTNALLYTNRAAASLMTLQYKEAVQDSDQAIALDANCAKAFFRKATALKGLGNIDGAIDALTAGLTSDPTNSVALQDKTTLLNAKAKITQARDLLERRLYSQTLTIIDQIAKDIGNAHREVNTMKVKALLALKRNEEALNLTNAMMRTAQNGDSELLSLRAQCLFNMGEIENALKHLQQAVRADPDNTTIRTQYRTVRDIEENKNRGDDYFKQGNFVEAINCWSHCISITKDSPLFQSKLFLNRGTAHWKQKKYEDAIKDCTKAIYYNRDYVKAYVRRAECYMSSGGPENIQKAIEDYESAVELENDEDVQETYKDKLKKAKVALKRSKRKDLYALLGVGQDASESEIKTAYKKAALKYHPDKHASKTEEEKKQAESMFKTIGEAYEVLSNPEKKARYDSGVELEDLDNPHAGEGGYGGHGGHGHGGIDPNILFQMFMQQQGGGGGGFRF